MKLFCALAFLFVFVSASASFAAGADPLKVHEAGFGPEIRGLQLGKSMTWPQMINTQSNILTRHDLPGMPKHLPFFGIIIADNYKAASHKWTMQKYPQDLSGEWIVVTFGAGQVTISNRSGGIGSKVPESGTVDDLFVILKKNGLNYIGAPDIVLFGERVIEYSVNKDELPAEAATAGDFAGWLSKTYSLDAMEQKGKNYEIRNLSEGWRVVVTDSKMTVFSMPIGKPPLSNKHGK
jgi:hypothetical protein